MQRGFRFGIFANSRFTDVDILWSGRFFVSFCFRREALNFGGNSLVALPRPPLAPLLFLNSMNSSSLARLLASQVTHILTPYLSKLFNSETKVSLVKQESPLGVPYRDFPNSPSI